MPNTTEAAQETPQTPRAGDVLLPGGTMRFDGTPCDLHAAAERLNPHAPATVLKGAYRWTRLPEQVPPDPRLERTRAVWLHHHITGTPAERDGWYLLTSATADCTALHLYDCEPAIRTGPLDCDPEELHHCLMLYARAGAPIGNAREEDAITERADEIVRNALATRVYQTAHLLANHASDLNPATLDDRLCLLQRACDERRIWLDG